MGEVVRTHTALKAQHLAPKAEMNSRIAPKAAVRKVIIVTHTAKSRQITSVTFVRILNRGDAIKGRIVPSHMALANCARLERKHQRQCIKDRLGNPGLPTHLDICDVGWM